MIYDVYYCGGFKQDKPNIINSRLELKNNGEAFFYNNLKPVESANRLQSERKETITVIDEMGVKKCDVYVSATSILYKVFS